MRYYVSFVLMLVTSLSGSLAHAGFIEIGGSANYRRVNLADDIYDESTSITGTVSYLFDAMSAFEVSYTDGQSTRHIGSISPRQTTIVDYSLLGLDFILTLGDREAVLRPYLKVGVSYILEKQLKTIYEGFPAVVDEADPTIVPSAGVGFRLLLGKGLSLKAGIDAQSSQSITKGNVKWDYMGRVGLAWMF